MLKKDLVANGLIKFDDDPTNYGQWKTTFKGVIEELELSPKEEADLLIKWLGTKSAKSMMRIRAVYSNDPTSGLKTLWDRLDEEYGASDLIEGLLISKIQSFPKIGRDQPQKLREFADLLCVRLEQPRRIKAYLD
ncbi:hypothetical protein HOLleu_18307 [Holothuria leucospilota]|uniref:Uncharacterized protein n=1 Tax=Holothuria leucospilota TaxID=206669 RepID=A0A9Q1H6K9_HOLLE|nr:hypothetical protein HOLleu_18307 [Holothuria leucospilota]